MSQSTGNSVKVVLSFDAVAELSDFQKNTQRSFQDFVCKLRANPSLPGLHVEPVHGAKNKSIRSIRITHGCRAIVAKEARTNTYMILHLDEGHDDAYAWVKRHRLTTDMLANTIRLEDAPDREQLARLLAEGADDDSHVPHKDPFAAFSDDDLIGFGIPEAGVNVLRAAPSPAAAKAMSWLLTAQPRSCVELALEGYSKADITGALADARRQGESYGVAQTESTKEFIDAAGDNQAERGIRTMLTSNGTQQQFVVLTDDQDLERLLNAPLAQWRIFLHPTQRAVVDADYSGPARVTGGAGTGKTVIAMHRARRLARDLIRKGEDGEVLLTTFTTTLADDMARGMKLLCSGEELKRIRVINLDKWLRQFLRGYMHDSANGHERCDIMYGVQGKADLDRLWRQAETAAVGGPVVNLTIDFLAQEWEQVVMANAITDLDAYLRVPRRGRGMRLNEAQRRLIWKIMEQYRRQMDRERTYDQAYAMHVAANLMNGPCRSQRFASIVVDEGQDLGAPAYRLLRSMVDEHPNDIFIAGDNHQQLYGNRVSLKQCGIQIAGRSSRLKVNYRTTEEIKTAAEAAERAFITGGFVNGSDMAAAVLKAVRDARDGGHSQPETRLDSQKATSGQSATSSVVLEDSLGGVFDGDGQDASKEEETFGDGASLSYGEWPEATGCKDWSGQFERVRAWIDGRFQRDPSLRPKDICVIVPTRKIASSWEAALKAKTPYGALQLKNRRNAGRSEEEENAPGIRVTTVHRAKGLEFDYVAVPDVNQYPLRQTDRNLLYVAMTRPRKELLVTAVM